MYDPSTGKDYSQESTVTVSQNTRLVNQMIKVSWTGFTPSANAPYSDETTDYPVMVAECDRLRPTNPDQCFGATNGGADETETQYGATNTAYSVTLSNGTGATDITIFTGAQNQMLGCGQRHACSLVVVPSQGGDSLDYNPPHCDDHSVDTGGTDTGQYAFTTLPTSACSWAKRIVIPLHFAPTPSGCPLRAADFTAQGSPMLARAMAQWQSAICEGSSSIAVQYNSSVNEAQARNAFASGLTDVAFTTEPMTSGTTTKHAYTYAPVAVSAATVAYWVDNQSTLQPYTSLKLDARLLAKLLTTSYAYGSDGCPSSTGSSCDSGVDGDPSSFFTDPEFEKLNPAITNYYDTSYQIPTVVSGESDITWTTTSWIAADKSAASFLAGTFDPWGAHVNTYYLGLKYPTDTITTQDPFTPVALQYSPVFPLSKIAYYQALNWQPGLSDSKDDYGNYIALTPETVGERALFAITDESDAAAFLFPTAALENHAGKYVEPTMASMAAAVKDMTVNSDGITRSVNENSEDPKAYPLTMVIYAVVPTSGISHTKAAKIAQFLRYVADSGQRTGNNPGQLAAGYLPLPESLREQTLKAATEVLDQTGNPSSKPSVAASSSQKPATKPATPTATPSASRTPEDTHQIAVTFSSAYTAGLSRIVLALLILGCAFALVGPAGLIYASPRGRAAVRGVARRITSARIRRKKP